MTPLRRLRPFTLFAFALLLAGTTSCRTAGEAAATWKLTGTVWKVAELEGQMVGTARIPTLQLEPRGNRVRAFGGVNQQTGTYRREGSALVIDPLVSTQVAGGEAEREIEVHFLRVLGLVTNYRLRGTHLILLAGDRVVARAEGTPGIPFSTP